MPELYSDGIIPSLRFRYCPMCRAGLELTVPFDDGIKRASCVECGWIHSLGNALGVVAVVRRGGDILAIQPPGEDGVALPAGLVEYGEAPEEAVLREILEETGIVAEIVRCLGWEHAMATGWPGPQVRFMYEAKARAGELRGSSEGAASWYPLGAFPKIISSRRAGSRSTLRRYLDQVAEEPPGGAL